MNKVLEKRSETEGTGQRQGDLHHPFFDGTDMPNSLDCLDAISRAASVIELMGNLNLDGDAGDGISPSAASGHRCLSMTVQQTLAYCARRLATLDRERQEKSRREARYLGALLNSLAVLDETDRDNVLDGMAMQLRISRMDVDAFVAGAGN